MEEKNFYLALFIDKKDNYLAVEIYSENIEVARNIAKFKIRKIYKDIYSFHSIRKMKESTKFIYQ